MISVVYYAWVKTDNDWKKIIYGQMEDLIKTGLCDTATIYVNLCCDDQALIQECRAYIINIIPKAIISLNYTNKYEYYGIYKIWEISQKNPDKNHLILYFHSKGMSYNNGQRSLIEKTLTKHVVSEHVPIINMFKKNSYVNEAGVAVSPEGWIWWNFFWTRASYIYNNCEKPISTYGRNKIIDIDRHYYESWLSGKNKNYKDCYSIANNSIGRYSTQPESVSIITSLSQNVIKNGKVK